MWRPNDLLKAVCRRLLSLELMRIGQHAYACIPSGAIHEAWFNLDVQRQQLFRRLQVDLVIDVGANTGQFGTAIRRSYSGEILSFEPSSATFGRLEETTAADPLWRISRCALGQETGQLELKLSPHSVFNSFLAANDYCEERFGSGSRPVSSETVEVRRLDEVAPELVPAITERRIFVKLDTQGFDLQAFLGMKGILDSVVAFQSEVSVRALYEGAPGWLQSLGVYEAAGFKIAGLVPVVVDQSGYPIEYDCLMVRQP
jgi:FkbM family methyltransferase